MRSERCVTVLVQPGGFHIVARSNVRGRDPRCSDDRVNRGTCSTAAATEQQQQQCSKHVKTETAIPCYKYNKSLTEAAAACCSHTHKCT